MANQPIQLTSERLSRLWWDGKNPVLLRRSGKKLMLRLPYAKDNGAWIQSNRRNEPKYDQKWKCWVTPKSWLNELVHQCLDKYERLYIVQPIRRHEKCAPACWDAKGFECQCSCMGINHGAGKPHGNWKEISETLAVKVGTREYSCRLVTPRGFVHEVH